MSDIFSSIEEFIEYSNDQNKIDNKMFDYVVTYNKNNYDKVFNNSEKQKENIEKWNKHIMNFLTICKNNLENKGMYELFFLIILSNSNSWCENCNDISFFEYLKSNYYPFTEYTKKPVNWLKDEHKINDPEASNAVNYNEYNTYSYDEEGVDEKDTIESDEEIDPDIYHVLYDYIFITNNNYVYF